MTPDYDALEKLVRSTEGKSQGFMMLRSNIYEMIAHARLQEERIGRLRGALEIYKHLRPEQQYNATGMTDDELSAELIKFPELIARGVGGSLAKEALSADDELAKGAGG